MAIIKEKTDMDNADEFIIEDGVLDRYKGDGGDVIIPEGVTNIGYFAFGYCSNLKSITIPKSVTYIVNRAGVVFPMGLMMVVMTGAELFTGDCLAIMATVQKKHTALKLIRMLVVVYLGNLLGSLMLTCIDYVSGQYNYSSGILGAYTIKVALGKCNLDFTTALASGILCNILVCAAVMLAARAKDVTGKLLCCFFIILLFVVSGYEHCVANMYYVPAGMIAKLNPLYVKDAMEQYGYTAQQLSTLNIPNFIFNNLIPVTIGNIVGGMAFFGIPLMYINGVGGKKA